MRSVDGTRPHRPSPAGVSDDTTTGRGEARSLGAARGAQRLAVTPTAWSRLEFHVHAMLVGMVAVGVPPGGGRRPKVD
jgi:hypothetical protein